MKALVTDPIHPDALDALRHQFDLTTHESSQAGLADIISSYDVLIVRSRTKVTREVLQRSERLRVVGRAGVGVDNIDVKAATERGILVVNAPAGSSQSVAELAVGLMLSLARRIPWADRSIKGGRWEKGELRGKELAGKTLGLVGAGRIGSLVATICQGFGMTVLAYDPYLLEEEARTHGIRLTALDEVLRESDFLSVHAALTEETHHMLGYAEFQAMKPTAFLANLARGPIVEEAALVRALKDGLLAGAGLDVYEREPPIDSPLLKLDNVVLTPHIGAATEEAQRRTGLLVVEQVAKAIAGQDPEFLVNPEALGI